MLLHGASSSIRTTLPRGSYAHRTIINPVRANDEFDADLLVEMDEVDECSRRHPRRGCQDCRRVSRVRS